MESTHKTSTVNKLWKISPLIFSNLEALLPVSNANKYFKPKEGVTPVIEEQQEFPMPLLA